MKFKEFYSSIESSVEDIKSKFNITDSEIMIRSDNKYHSILGGYVEMRKDGDLCIVFDRDRKILSPDQTPDICHYISNFEMLSGFKEWLDAHFVCNKECFEVSEGIVFKVCGFNMITKYRFNEKPRVEIYIKSEIIVEDKPSTIKVSKKRMK